MFIIDGLVFLFTVIPTFRFYIQEDTLSFQIGLMGLSCYTLRVGTEKITWNKMQDIAIGDLKGIGNKQF